MTNGRREADVAIASIEVGDRLRKPDMETIAELAKDLSERGMLQRIGVRERANGKHDLIWGRHRLEAVGRLGWSTIGAVVYPADAPDRELRILEILENLRRKELFAKEKQEHTIRLAALIKDTEPAETRSASEFPAKPARGPGGRGRKGVTAKVAEKMGVDPSAVRQRAKAAAEAIAEPIDLERDPPEVLHGKADKVRAVSKPPKAKSAVDRKPKVKPARPDVTVAIRQLRAALPSNFSFNTCALAVPEVQRKNLLEDLKHVRIMVEGLIGELRRLKAWQVAPEPSAVEQAPAPDRGEAGRRPDDRERVNAPCAKGA